MATTIQVSEKLVSALKQKKLYTMESYEDVIWVLLEDTMELNEETKRDVVKSIAEAKACKVYSLEQVEKEIGL